MLQTLKGIPALSVLLMMGCAILPSSKESHIQKPPGQRTVVEPPSQQEESRISGNGASQRSAEAGGQKGGTEKKAEQSARTASNQVTKETVDEIKFGTERLALTEALGRAQERVKIQEQTISDLEEKLEKTQAELNSVRTERDNLQGKLETLGKQLGEFEESMGKWKKDVLGFRDEMREAEKAEMQALKQIIILLRKARGDQKEAGEGSQSKKGGSSEE